MRMIFKLFAKKLFGVKYERIRKNILIFLIVFWGLHIANFQIQIAPSILYLMAGTFTAGVMWQALCSEDNTVNMTNLFMLPFEDSKLIFSYVSALGAYILITKTGLLLAVVFAISSWNASAIVGSILCTMNAVIMVACVFSFKKYRVIGLLWVGITIAVIFLENSSFVLLAMLTGNILLGIGFLKCLNAYSFYRKAEIRHRLKKTRNYSVWRYLFRYLVAHKNYMMNTVVMCVIACILPMFFRQIGTLFALPVGFAILSLNTPICILLSCDPALEQAVRFLPSQKKAFCVPYCLFIFLCNMPIDIIFLFSWEIQIGNITIYAVLISVFFALQSSIVSALLEWFYPIRGWKIESDLWHHPRKYVVPVAMLLIAGVVGTLSWLVFVLAALLLLEVAILLFQCRRH